MLILIIINKHYQIWFSREEVRPEEEEAVTAAVAVDSEAGAAAVHSGSFRLIQTPVTSVTQL